jgi:hypothetical protein
MLEGTAQKTRPGRLRCNIKSIAKGYGPAFQFFWIARLTL